MVFGCASQWLVKVDDTQLFTFGKPCGYPLTPPSRFSVWASPLRSQVNRSPRTVDSGLSDYRGASEQMVEIERENRLRLKPYRSASEHIDGAWWPQSMKLVDELPDLVTSLSDRLGRVVMVGYRRNGWHETPPLAEIAGHTIELLGFTSDEPASVIVISEDGRHITLHVIRPDASEETARQALEKVSVPVDATPAGQSMVAKSVADVADKLAKHEGLDDQQRTAQIKRWTEDAAQQFADAPLQTFVPILVEHIVRNRMMESRQDQRHQPAESLTS